MALIPYKHFWDLFDEEWPERWLPEIPSFQAPRIDVYEDNGNVVAEAGIPGVEPKDIEVEVQDNILKIEAKREEKKEEKKKGYYRKELSKGYYRRAIPLPVEVIGEKAQASYKDGILKVVIPKVKPKKEKKKGVKIKVK
jgi:HSP20 family protein